MTAETLHVGKRADLEAVATQMALSRSPQAPLYAAAANSKIALISAIDPETSWPTETIAKLSKPVIFLLGGDPGLGEPAFGPDVWHCSELLRCWAACAMVHGTAGDREHYAAAVAMAMTTGRLALIETTSALVRAWYRFLSPVPTICIVPPDGDIHPARPTALQ